MSSEATLLLPEPTTPAANKHCSQSIKELCQRLAELSPSKSRGKLTPEERTIVYVLKSKRLRSAGDAHAFRESDGLTLLLQLVTSCREEDGKDLVLLLGTLANLCALEAESRSFVRCYFYYFSATPILLLRVVTSFVFLLFACLGDGQWLYRFR